MIKTRVLRPAKTPKSVIDVIRGPAIKKHAKRPDHLDEIERITWAFQKKMLSGEVLDLPAALQQFKSDIEQIGAIVPRPPKDSGPKLGPAKRADKHWVGGGSKAKAARGWKRKTASQKPRQASKRGIVKT